MKKTNENSRIEENSTIIAGTNSNQAATINISYADQGQIQISLNINGFSLNSIPSIDSYALESIATSNLLIKGSPDLPKHVTSIIIAEESETSISVLNMDQYIEYHDYTIAPSRGNILRDDLFDQIRYQEDDAVYLNDEFFPNKLVELSAPYQLGELTGQNIIFYPYQYNPVTQTLRVYLELEVEVDIDNGLNKNPVLPSPTEVSETMDIIYNNHFINYERNDETVVTQGKLLILVADGFYDDENQLAASSINLINTLADWKAQKGLETQIKTLSMVKNELDALSPQNWDGNLDNADEIKLYIDNYYNQNGLDFLMLIGNVKQGSETEVDQIPYNNQFIMPSPVVEYMNEEDGSDISYSFITGNDYSYPHFSVGRIAADDFADLDSQITRILNYEQEPSGSWYSNTLSIASTQGSGNGFEGNSDYLFNEEILWPILSDPAGPYSSYAGLYDSGLSYFEGLPEDLINETYSSQQHKAFAIDLINNYGIGLINYTGHGSSNGWSNGAAIKISDVENLDNTELLPFVITVGCEVAEFSNSNYFTQTWLQATNDENQPVGAIAHFGSTILQGWAPPMYGQLGMNCLIAQSSQSSLDETNYCAGDYLSNLDPIYTLGGITTQGTAYMNSAVGTAGVRESIYWTLFGDPSLELRTEEPSVMTPSVCGIKSEDNAYQELTIRAEQNDWITLSKQNEGIDELLLTTKVNNSNGLVTLDLTTLNLSASNTYTLTTTGHNKTPFQKTLEAEDFIIGPVSDINQDGVINILDIILISNQILNSNDNERTNYGDVNCDSIVNVQDIVQTLNSILHPDLEDDDIFIGL